MRSMWGRLDCMEMGKGGFNVLHKVRSRGQRLWTCGPPPPPWPEASWALDAKHCFLICFCILKTKSAKFTGIELAVESLPPPPLDRQAQCFFQLLMILALKASSSLSALARIPELIFLGQTIAFVVLLYHTYQWRYIQNTSLEYALRAWTSNCFCIFWESVQPGYGMHQLELHMIAHFD